MRTTLAIDDDLLQTAKELAAARGLTTGQVVSELMRKGLEPARGGRIRSGVPVLPHRPVGAPRPTMRLINALRDEP